MPVTKYQYTISTDTATGKVYPDQLQYEIAVSIPAVAVDHIDVGIEPDKLDIYMSDALDAAQQATLTATVAAHLGYGVVADLKGTTLMASSELAVVEDANWQHIGGVVTTPHFFEADVTKIISRIIGEYNGDGGQVRFVENLDGVGDEEKVNPFYEFADSAGQWKRFKVDSNVVPRDGVRNVYELLCRRNGAAALSIRHVTVSMIVVNIM